MIVSPLYVCSRVWAQDGLTARDLAEHNGHTAMAAFLEKVGVWFKARTGARVGITPALHAYGGRAYKHTFTQTRT